MSAPTQLQQSDLGTFLDTSGTLQQSYGAYFDPLLAAAITAVCAEYPHGPGNLTFSDAIDLYCGYLMWQSISNHTLEPDSSSANPTLAFVGRLREIYAEQNP